MRIDYLINGIIAVGIFIYLGYALFKPERL
jgi:K+-transporting ATPase KdpF subunit